MFKKSLVITAIFIIMFFSIVTVSASDNMTDVLLVENDNSLSRIDESPISDEFDDYGEYHEDENDNFAEANSIETHYNSGEKFEYLVQARSWNMKILKGDAVVYDESHYNDGEYFTYDIKDLSPGEYKVDFIDTSYMEPYLMETTSITILKSASKLTVNSFKATAGSTYTINAYLNDKYSGKNYDGAAITFKINGKSYTANVKNGVASLKIKVPKTIKTYASTAAFKGNENVSGSSSTFKMTVNPIPIKTKVSAPSVTMKENQNKKFKITVKTLNGKAVKKLKLKVKISSDVFTVKTNQNGIAYVSLKNLAPTSHKVIISSGNSKYTVSKTSKVTVKKLSSSKSVTLKVRYSNYPITKKLSNGDVISTNYEKVSGRQFDPGVYALVSHGEGLVNAKYTKLIKSTVWFKNSQGKIITKSSSKFQYNWFIKVNLVNGFTPYKAQIWYK